MTKKGEHTPVTDQEAEDFARRMAERGADEATIRNPVEWHQYVDETFELEWGRTPTDLQRGLIDKSRYLFEAGMEQSGLRMMQGVIRGKPFFRYADTVTGRILSASDAYSRRYELGLSTPIVKGKMVWSYFF